MRIQLPCGAGGSILPTLQTLTASCDGGCSDSPQSAVCPPVPPLPPCGSASRIREFDPDDIWDPLVDSIVLPKVQERLTLASDDLPLLRRQLEVKLKMAEFAQEAAQQARARVEEQMRDLSVAEEQLAQHQADE
ncbi:hypothetical protein [Kineosporia sp. NBRC 101731]|uniref:hypothetical protein n=1 Tax=Kineosporia sp. NBRC 101731 TaxID=3032199 RepID=UPI0024A4BDFA|nr:hypothetical protein [Kineosporia sp. NBRC 101731]GLY29862.1 hypothetical protein Kisp02_32270 [Kineosporia sp. NBRC 101731]